MSNIPRHEWVKGVDEKWHISDSWERGCCKISKYLMAGKPLYELKVYHVDCICQDCLDYTKKQEAD